jgi:hypothetical protein
MSVRGGVLVFVDSGSASNPEFNTGRSRQSGVALMPRVLADSASIWGVYNLVAWYAIGSTSASGTEASLAIRF